MVFPLMINLACACCHQYQGALFQQFYFWLLSSFGPQVSQTVVNGYGTPLVFSGGLFNCFWFIQIDEPVEIDNCRDLPHDDENSVDITSVIMCQILHRFRDCAFCYIGLHGYPEARIQDFCFSYSCDKDQQLF